MPLKTNKKEKNKKLKVAIKDKQQEFVNNGGRSKKSCAKTLMNFSSENSTSKLHKEGKIKENYWFSDY